VKRKRVPSADRERGAVLVELALVAPVLILLLLGIVDFGWAFSENLDVRHGAREASRLVAVNYRPNANSGTAQADDIVTEVCRRIDGGAGTTVTLQIPAGQPGDVGSVGQYASVTIARPAASLSGLFSPVLNGRSLRSEVATRIEVTATWTSDNAARSKTCA
jgi:hypothetical protein